jgi:hypothetical protein
VSWLNRYWYYCVDTYWCGIYCAGAGPRGVTANELCYLSRTATALPGKIPSETGSLMRFEHLSSSFHLSSSAKIVCVCFSGIARVVRLGADMGTGRRGL